MTDNKIKSGTEMLDDFFQEITKNDDIDSDIASTVIELYKSDNLTVTKLTNGLSELRKNEAK